MSNKYTAYIIKTMWWILCRKIVTTFENYTKRIQPKYTLWAEFNILKFKPLCAISGFRGGVQEEVFALWDAKKHWLVISNHYFGTVYRFHLLG
jgi:hypothetical protein